MATIGLADQPNSVFRVAAVVNPSCSSTNGATSQPTMT